ncbi:MAG: hypothetical protein E5Y73_35355 [Mesorhizobium sp.]|uniref:hypothetical protein n=1 Tax=Mesorhizobium sp. TaxID=1871066 RepID=UPI0011F578BE|nr:hypothetical protein [Mesorhizobium sp.]TIL83981.1 MAG: hypothetical protein E5Y73_35355 [Mesorhizobium sp.]
MGIAHERVVDHSFDKFKMRFLLLLEGLVTLRIYNKTAGKSGGTYPNGIDIWVTVIKGNTTVVNAQKLSKDPHDPSNVWKGEDRPSGHYNIKVETRITGWPSPFENFPNDFTPDVHGVTFWNRDVSISQKLTGVGLKADLVSSP